MLSAAQPWAWVQQDGTGGAGAPVMSLLLGGISRASTTCTQSLGSRTHMVPAPR